jgi:outer membrane protein OmpA-like peptidoglycan-associated protein/opacity protein-like surface antigen
MRHALALIAAAVMAATSASAAERTGFYVGGDVGQSNWNLSGRDARVLTENIAAGIASFGDAEVIDVSDRFSDTDTTYSLFVGYQVAPWFAIEATWMDLGKMDVESRGTYTYNVVNPEPGDRTGGSYNVRTEFESSGPAISGLLMLPFMDVWNLYGRLGYYMGDNELSIRGSATDTGPGGIVFPTESDRISASDDSGVFLWGAGVSYTWDQRVSFRLEYTNITDVVEIDRDNSSDMERFTLGAVYRFGRVSEPMAPMAAAAPVAVAAAPTKCADSDNDGVCDADDRCPNTPAGDRVGPRGCSCDVTIRTHFAFDSAELTAQDKAELERVAARLKELEFVGGTATGHTDSVGDEAYNQKLSERRAQAVVDFLHAQGVSPSRITAIGMGEIKPIADNATEEGRAQNRRVTIRRTDCGPAE